MLMINEQFDRRRLPPVLLAGGGLWLLFFALLAYVLPAVPVDETRYLTVAWEMHLSHHWFLETVNGEPYSHKPPLLFWLINLVWAATGPQIWAARLVAGAAALGLYALTHRLARTLYPGQPLTQTLAPLFLLACPAFLVYGGLIMFDTLLACCSLAALIQVWRAKEGQRHAWLLFGLFTGLGVLVKGPVIALYVAFPALLAPWIFAQLPGTRRRWYFGLLGGLLIATAIGLAWAIPAAIAGGKDFAQMLFVKQSAGRMVESFAHRRPFWFYLPCWPVFALPLLVWPPFWRALAQGRAAARDVPLRFLAAAIVGPFLCFSAISGKQVHYMLPLLPLAALLLAALLSRAASLKPATKSFDALGPVLLFTLTAIGGVLFLRQPASLHSGNRLIAATAGDIQWPVFAAAMLLALAAALALRRRLETQALSVALAMMLAGSAALWQAGRTILPGHDLRPVGVMLAPYKNGPLAYAEKYDGELGFVARLPHPLDVLDMDEVSGWLAKHPDGTIIIRHDRNQTVDKYGKMVGNFDYRADQEMTLLRANDAK